MNVQFNEIEVDDLKSNVNSIKLDIMPLEDSASAAGTQRQHQIVPAMVATFVLITIYA